MEKIILIASIFCILIVVHGTENSYADDNAIRWNLENFEIDEGDEVDDPLFWKSEHGNKVLVNVDGLGAVGDGISDDTQVNGA